jgi:hypothetical protein
MGEGRNVYRVLVGQPKGKSHLEDQGLDERIGSKWTLGRLAARMWRDFTWPRIGMVGGLL